MPFNRALHPVYRMGVGLLYVPVQLVTFCYIVIYIFIYQSVFRNKEFGIKAPEFGLY